MMVVIATSLQPVEAIRSQGNSLTETTSKQVCGNFLCDEPMSIAEKVAAYLLSLAQQEEPETNILQQFYGSFQGMGQPGQQMGEQFGGVSPPREPRMTMPEAGAKYFESPELKMKAPKITAKSFKSFKSFDAARDVKASNLAGRLIEQYDLKQDRVSIAVGKVTEGYQPDRDKINAMRTAQQELEKIQKKDIIVKFPQKSTMKGLEAEPSVALIRSQQGAILQRSLSDVLSDRQHEDIAFHRDCYPYQRLYNEDHPKVLVYDFSPGYGSVDSVTALVGRDGLPEDQYIELTLRADEEEPGLFTNTSYLWIDPITTDGIHEIFAEYTRLDGRVVRATATVYGEGSPHAICMDKFQYHSDEGFFVVVSHPDSSVFDEQLGLRFLIADEAYTSSAVPLPQTYTSGCATGFIGQSSASEVENNSLIFSGQGSWVHSNYFYSDRIAERINADGFVDIEVRHCMPNWPTDGGQPTSDTLHAIDTVRLIPPLVAPAQGVGDPNAPPTMQFDKTSYSIHDGFTVTVTHYASNENINQIDTGPRVSLTSPSHVYSNGIQVYEYETPRETDVNTGVFTETTSNDWFYDKDFLVGDTLTAEIKIGADVVATQTIQLTE